MFVRHPLHRILSAYRDKFFFPTGENKFIYNLFADSIKRNYPDTTNITFQPPSKAFVTFKQFMSFVVGNSRHGYWLNDHFAPFYDLCRPCDIKYDFVGKMETMQMDSQFIINKFYKNSTISSLPGMSPTTKLTHGPEVRDMFSNFAQGITVKFVFFLPTRFWHVWIFLGRSVVIYRVHCSCNTIDCTICFKKLD